MESFTIWQLYWITASLGACAGLARELKSKEDLTLRGVVASVLWGALNATASGLLYKEFFDKEAISTVPVIGLAAAMGGAFGLDKLKDILRKGGVAVTFDALRKNNNGKAT